MHVKPGDVKSNGFTAVRMLKQHYMTVCQFFEVLYVVFIGK